MVLLIGWFSAAAGAGAITGWPGTKGAAAAADESCGSACSSPAGGGKSDSTRSCWVEGALDSSAAGALDSGAAGAFSSGAASGFDSGAVDALDCGAAGTAGSGAAGAALLTGAAELSGASAQPAFSHSAAASDDASRE